MKDIFIFEGYVYNGLQKNSKDTVLPAAVEIPRTLLAHSTITHKAELFMAKIKQVFSFRTFVDS